MKLRGDQKGKAVQRRETTNREGEGKKKRESIIKEGGRGSG